MIEVEVYRSPDDVSSQEHFSLLSDHYTTDLSLPTIPTQGTRTLYTKITPVPVTIDKGDIQLFKN